MDSRRRWTDEQLQEALAQAQSLREVLVKLNLSPQGSNYKTIRIHIERLKLPCGHIKGQSWSRGQARPHTRGRSLDQILVENSTCLNTSYLKFRLVKTGLLQNTCSSCGISEWRGKALSLHLDHINGNNRDNRIENLRLLCPNCHSLTPTYCGRNTAKVTPGCKRCGTPIASSRAKHCAKCTVIGRPPTPTKIKWPPVDEIQDRVGKNGYLQTARELGVSDNAVRKYIQRTSAGSNPARGTITPE